MYQVNATYAVKSVVTQELNWLQKLLGARAEATYIQDGKLSFVAESIQDMVNKLNYLVADQATIKSLNVVEL
jgi:L-cysteine desulfidase